MKRIVLLSLALMSIASMAFAQAGVIGAYTDELGTDCQIADVPGLVTVYLIQTGTAGSTAVQFAIQNANGNALVYLAATGRFPLTIGAPNTGTSPVRRRTARFGSIGSINARPNSRNRAT